ncbi:DNA-directed RNA polymerase subunit beta' [Candidatus Kaiserbacteria bacterium CG10_big_fil_rev_8_21_14_0_10_45_20]|uniref:DNA-directed RNA polymerase subunit beta' n=1 Tax=Candidatus Kaiserbacteria bacterium CG10_big_fil_rev_8_21_14_0_10_45_20 TaxID=1974607 RepID=A0A2H0UGB8_9BACT|nr:MAG: DNA-directed RNA polymerase subunit beta' [Candidatus Kaiserbacteria bacterium CG10_big_fil_rev_8_21_14_0_10_45_20]
MDQKRGTTPDTIDFDWMALKLASPERILEWSWGEVRKPETINYRTQRSEKDGLFDERIFGPEHDYECYCGKYKGIRFRGIVCEKCGVEVTRAIVRRERMGHIDLITPVAHIWFLRSVPSRIALILGTSAIDAEKVIYFAGYIVTSVNETERTRLIQDLESEYKAKLKTVSNDKAKEELKNLMLTAKKNIESIQEGLVLDEIDYHRHSVKYGSFFEADIGAEAIYTIFKNLDLEKFIQKLETSLETATAAEREKLSKRLALARSMHAANVRPEWMFLTRIPVTPPAIRPMVALESGRHATSDVNDLYRRVINRNNRLLKLRDIYAPDVILRNEKRILQEAVDALLDNSIRRSGSAFSPGSQAQRRPLKSLADYLKGKQGYFRSNLLGKRVDYSGRSVIVIGPSLKLDECGLPKHMALELFRPFVISKLIERELAHNVRGAGRLIAEEIPEVWAILEEVIKGRHVLLNRAPTLHRQGIQAFRPTLIEGNAIQLHPLVCPAFNADFDGDQMAVHVPLSDEAQMEAAQFMSARKNILKPGSGDPVVASKLLDIVLGTYWMTRELPGEKGEGSIFHSPNAAILAYDFGVIGIHSNIWVQASDTPRYAAYKGERFETTVGRLLFNSVLPNDYPYINDEVKKSLLNKIVDDLIKKYGLEQMPDILDKIKNFGFKFATQSGITFSTSELVIPKEREALIEAAQKEVQEIQDQYQQGLLTREEKTRLVVEAWLRTKGEIEKYILPSLNTLSSIYMMVVSGARGSIGNVTQMTGMRGLMNNTKGEVIEHPVLSSMKQGLTPIEYFTTTHGARKGLSDTALKTAHAGYLTRRLFDVAQDVVTSEHDCGTKEGIFIKKSRPSGIEVDLAKLISGRVLAEDITTKDATFKKNTMLTPEDARAIADAEVEKVFVRSPMNCNSKQGVCQLCYGVDLASQHLVDVGEAVGTIAAQAIGEPGTQLTMRTFHTGGTASIGGDITNGLPRVEELFDRRPPKGAGIISHVDGEVIEIREDEGQKVVVVLPDVGSDGASKNRDKIEYPVPYRRVAMVKVGARLKKGDPITDGSINLDELFTVAGGERVQEYIIDEISKIYDLQGAPISHKHMEIIIRQMFSRGKVIDPGDSEFVNNEMVNNAHVAEVNEALKAEGKEPAKVKPLVLGITEVSLNRKSFLSAASFQHTTRTLIQASLRGTVDPLDGLKENVIIGRLIPAGTGFVGSKKHAIITEFQELRAKERAIEEARQEEM